MRSAVRFILVLLALSLLFAPIHILLTWPRLPTSLAGWAAFLLLPLPLALLGEWLFQYRDFRVLRPIDALAMRVASSPYRLAIAVTSVLLVGVAAFGFLFFLPVS